MIEPLLFNVIFFPAVIQVCLLPEGLNEGVFDIPDLTIFAATEFSFSALCVSHGVF